MAQRGEGLEALLAISGPARRHPPPRVLFHAYRLRASGCLELREGRRRALVGLKHGKVAELRGFPGLLEGLDPELAGLDELGPAMEAAFAKGYKLPEILEAAAHGFARGLASWVFSEGQLRFDGTCAPEGFPVDWNLTAVLAEALSSDEALERTRARLKGKAGWHLRSRYPSDSPPERWGLDPLSTRLLALARRGITLRSLVLRGEAAGHGRRELLATLSLLLHLGLLELHPHAQLRTPGGHRADKQESDPLAELQASRERLEKAFPLERLDILDPAERPDAGALGEAFRRASRRYHPDRYAGARSEVRRLAAECFALVQEAYEQLLDPTVLDEEMRRVDCERRGEPYVPREQAMKARIAIKKGETLFRNRNYRLAEAVFAEALELDPTSWEAGLYHALSAYYSRQMPLDEALQRLSSLKPPDARARARVEVALGQLLQLGGEPPEKALQHFRKALELDPENVDAQRALRLHELRSRRAEAPSPASPLLSRLFRRED